MNKPASKEPSMDEILSSIRQIIADEDAPETAGGAPASDIAEPEKVEEAADAQMKASEPLPAAVVEQPEELPEEASEEAPLELSSEQIVSEPAVSEDIAAASEEDFAVLNVEDAPEVEVLPEAIEESVLDAVSEDAGATDSALELVIADDIAFDEVAEEAEVEVEPTAMPDPELSTEIAEKLLEPTTTAAVSHTFAKLGALTIGGDDLTLDGMLRDMLRPMLKEWLDDNLPATVERMVQKEIERISRGG